MASPRHVKRAQLSSQVMKAKFLFDQPQVAERGDEALKLLEKLEQNLNLTVRMQESVREALETGKYPIAKDYLNSARNLFSERTHILLCLRKLGFGSKVEEATALGTSVLSSVASMQLKLKMYKEVLNTCDEAILLGGDSKCTGPAYHHRGVSYLHQGDLLKAHNDLAQAAQLMPGDKLVKQDLAVVTEKLAKELGGETKIQRQKGKGKQTGLPSTANRAGSFEKPQGIVKQKATMSFEDARSSEENVVDDGQLGCVRANKVLVAAASARTLHDGSGPKQKSDLSQDRQSKDEIFQKGLQRRPKMRLEKGGRGIRTEVVAHKSKEESHSAEESRKLEEEKLAKERARQAEAEYEKALERRRMELEWQAVREAVEVIEQQEEIERRKKATEEKERRAEEERRRSIADNERKAAMVLAKMHNRAGHPPLALNEAGVDLYEKGLEQRLGELDNLALQDFRSKYQAAAPSNLQGSYSNYSNQSQSQAGGNHVSQFSQSLISRSNIYNPPVNQSFSDAVDIFPWLKGVDEVTFKSNNHYGAPSSTVEYTPRFSATYGPSLGQNLAPAPADPADAATIGSEAAEHHCCICFENPRTAVALPCGHLSTCETCLQTIHGSSSPYCPMCRNTIEEIVVLSSA